MNSEAANLTAAIADLRRRRQDLDTAIATMEKILVTVYGGGSVGTTRRASLELIDTDTLDTPNARRVTGQTRPGTRADQVRKVLVENPHKVWTSEMLAEAINEPADEHTIKAIHAILSRLRRAQVIEKLGRGEYRAVDPSGPAEAGPEVDVTAAGEGGDSNAQADRDHGDLAEDHHRDDRRGAPVGASTS